MLALVLALAVPAACGKKGPPLAPLVRVPAAVDALEATRVGNDVYVTLTIPTSNIDGFTPADLARIEIYGYTGRSAPPRGRFVEFGTHVASVPVAPPPNPGTADGAAPEEPRQDLPVQGGTITVRDTLTPEELVAGPVPAVEPRVPGTGVASATASPAALPDAPLRRYYTAYPFSPRGRPAPPGATAELPLLPVPDPPPHVEVSYTARELALRWDPSGGLLGFLLERTLPVEPLPPDLEDERLVEGAAAPPATGPLAYNVYRDDSVNPFAPPGTAEPPAWREQPPAPLNPAPVAAREFALPVAFGEPRCYTVRAVRGTGASARVGEPSPPACVMPVDTFAPAPPRALATVASEGAISLIWEPNGELDLGGYLVLRGEAAGDTLQPLTPQPVTDAAYRDTAVTPGVRYVYAVVAIDTRFPLPNVSAESDRVEETAR